MHAMQATDANSSGAFDASDGTGNAGVPAKRRERHH
jgi:hypothetical protein